VRDLAVAGGALLGALLWQVAPAVNLLTAAGIGVGGTLFYALLPPPAAESQPASG
jgi:hypothetical protein